MLLVERTASGNGVYAWILEGDELHFSLLHDYCIDRVGLLTGATWQRVP